IVNKVESPDVGLSYSMNPYQGCEHGCVYCYARNTHEYWGYSAGLDFERKILYKSDAPALLAKAFRKKGWEPLPIMLSGNTDCYQPLERKLKLTRGILEVCLKFKHPVGIITKNSLIVRDLDLISKLAEQNLVMVLISLTGLTEETRLLLEPRTATYKNRLKTIQLLTQAGVHTGIMMAPVIPGINSHEIASVLEQAAAHGAKTAGTQIVRLNGAIGGIFKDWLCKTYPDRADKVWNQIVECHGGTVNDSRFGTRMKGEGKIAEAIRTLFRTSKTRYMGNPERFTFNLEAFDPQGGEGQMSLF
ncbi:MAG TPA: PA0069 family radical SAM protein, partial [Bacteroidia bacterium]|nr:PA0069 family radical SAM protein [Bacteroidia bacterium]